MGLRPTNRDEAKVGQTLSPVQMWGRRSRLPTEASTVLNCPHAARKWMKHSAFRRAKASALPPGLESPLRGESILPGAEPPSTCPVFKREGRMVQPIQRVNVYLTASMLEELDKAAQDLNASRQAIIKTLVRQALDQHDLAQRARRPELAR